MICQSDGWPSDFFHHCLKKIASLNNELSYIKQVEGVPIKIIIFAHVDIVVGFYFLPIQPVSEDKNCTSRNGFIVQQTWAHNKRSSHQLILLYMTV